MTFIETVKLQLNDLCMYNEVRRCRCKTSDIIHINIPIY